MKRFDLIYAVLATVIAFPVIAADIDNNPPGPAGGAGTNWENRPGPQGGPGASPDRQRPQLTPEQREKMKAMTPEQRKQFVESMRKQRAERIGRDGNPPGPAGGAGTNWENRPGPQGGPGASPDRQRPQLTPEQMEKLKAMTPEERRAFMNEKRENRPESTVRP